MVHWVPLESNPDVFTDYAKKLGIDPKWVRSLKRTNIEISHLNENNSLEQIESLKKSDLGLY